MSSLRLWEILTLTLRDVTVCDPAMTRVESFCTGGKVSERSRCSAKHCKYCTIACRKERRRAVRRTPFRRRRKQKNRSRRESRDISLGSKFYVSSFVVAPCDFVIVCAERFVRLDSFCDLGGINYMFGCYINSQVSMQNCGQFWFEKRDVAECAAVRSEWVHVVVTSR